MEKPNQEKHMSFCPTQKSCIRTAAILAVGLSSAALVTPAEAQYYDPAAGPQPGKITEQVTVTPGHGRSSLGAPIEEVTTSLAVSYADLNVPTVQGNIAFRHRVRSAAKRVCNRLEVSYPAGEPNSYNCYKHAMSRVTPVVDNAIHTHPVTNVSLLP